MGDHRARLVWTVNCRANGASTEDARDQLEAAKSVLKLMERFQMAATWMLPDPVVQRPLCERITSYQGQEIGLLGESLDSNDRDGFARELARRVEPARNSGIPISTLSLSRLEGNLDLLVRHRISAVRVEQAKSVKSCRRFGVWQIASSEVVPSRQGFWGARASRAAIDQLIRDGQTALYVVDLAALGRGEQLKSLEAVCKHVARQGLKVCSFAELGRRLVSTEVVRPARSILKSA
ncbi:MAG: hypothetical protein KDB14_28140 [Planctomycetales bacterium]|nr:hypothetical protein [Planctomycetales bacterium]